MTTLEKLTILADSAKYDVSCSSSGSNRSATYNGIGNASAPGICHSFADDGRCISLLKILFTNACMYDCGYCINRNSNDSIKRVSFTPDELVDLVIQFYRRNYIEGLFLSSGVLRSPDYTMEQLIQVVKTLRVRENFNGYIHLKGIPGADAKLIREAGLYVDRMSLNIELPTSQSLRLLAPEKDRAQIIEPMKLIREEMASYRVDAKKFKKAKLFVPAGQTTQLIVGATPEPDYMILRISEAFYQKMKLKRVYYSSYVPVGRVEGVVPYGIHSLQREHRIYQADWLLRFYGFKASELLNEEAPDLDLVLDPKAQWALRNLHLFPIDVNRADLMTLLRVPGIGTVSARRILAARRLAYLDFDGLKRIGVVLKRAQYFITCKGKMLARVDENPMFLRQLLADGNTQLNLFDLYPKQFGGGHERLSI
ncbi:putative DNA modification/repair radical SAM protein [Fusibacter tunisiensis]|uniref:DNA modification/repair radical SAM protein n=1 Tax=Fusibacter tunisiensis TaxID=1008308 RepID=A0ABS2MSK4_9FIRM|nr:putative DNA modification/repair radical SAM protein [Fusibacter tunisiensis]MBM7562347.1 putative DNA modification/repair radical SAM protein [Fusibacter tunisiensis]